MNDRILTIPNIISFSRLVLAYPIAYCILQNNIVATVILGSIAIATDFFDGYLSRRLNQISTVGKVIDPIVDGLLVVTVMAALIIRRLLPLWYIKAIIIRYTLLVVMLSFYRIQYKKTPKSIPSGKWSMCAIAATITSALFQHTIPYIFPLAISLSLLLLTYSLYDYFSIYLYENN